MGQDGGHGQSPNDAHMVLHQRLFKKTFHAIHFPEAMGNGNRGQGKARQHCGAQPCPAAAGDDRQRGRQLNRYGAYSEQRCGSKAEVLHLAYGSLKASDGLVSKEKSKVGYVVGAGAEYGITDNLSAKLEYNYVSLGKQNFQFASGRARVGVNEHLVKAGLNYRF